MATIIQWVKIKEKQHHYKYGDIIIRERKGRYYVYKLEYENGNVKETYVDPLVDVVETYEKLKDSSGGFRGYPPNPTTDPPGFEPGTSGSGGRRSILAELRVQHKYTLYGLLNC
ncbi:Integrase, probable (fragment) [Saccharolobus solfataricus P2]|uniref:Integrase, probable n=2 Tax=Saccharolobus solfataricus TaxID=2287 RepID=Q980K4_SACS2